MKTVCVITGGGSGMGLAAAKCMPNKLKGYQASGLAYGLSKKFVIRYAAKCAYEYGAKGIRVCSLSPGLLATTAEKRMGKPEELAFA